MVEKYHQKENSALSGEHLLLSASLGKDMLKFKSVCRSPL